MSSGWNNEHAGEFAASDAFELLRENPNAQLVDVRTRAEWTFVGVPDLSSLYKEVVLVEWQKYPTMDVDPDFTEIVERQLFRLGVATGDPVLFLCRSGVRSLSAAKAMAATGWRDCRNIIGGFEGPLDEKRHRGERDGWKVCGLPWLQT